MNSVIEYLLDDVAKYPSRLALVDRERQISYEIFWEMTSKIGWYLKEELKLQSQPIGVIARHNVFTPIIFMGICSSGNFYVPIDPDMPREKLKKIILLSDIKIVLSDRENLDFRDIYSCEYVDIQNIIAENNAKALSCSKCIKERTLQEPFSVLYTSGSTGTPKGVLKTNGAFINFIESFTEIFDFEEHEIIGNQTPFYFDASAKDLLLALKLGATMVIIPTEMFSFPIKLIHYMNENKVTTILWVPSALSIVTQLNTFTEIKPTTLKRVFFVGEMFPMKHLIKWRENLPQIQYVNLYGSTEIAGIACYYKIGDEEQLTVSDNLPIGKPMPNCHIFLVEGDHIINEPNKSGEIYISSEALAKEYYKYPEGTKKAFFYCELNGNKIERYFKSGDIAHYDDKGNLVFETRRDFQIKHMGHRIELGEIETMAQSLDDVEKAGCVYDVSKNKIVLFCEKKKESMITEREIKRLLRDRLSSYMMPNKVILIDKMLLNSNGKIDRIALKKLL